MFYERAVAILKILFFSLILSHQVRSVIFCIFEKNLDWFFIVSFATIPLAIFVVVISCIEAYRLREEMLSTEK